MRGQLMGYRRALTALLLAAAMTVAACGEKKEETPAAGGGGTEETAAKDCGKVVHCRMRVDLPPVVGRRLFHKQRAAFRLVVQTAECEGDCGRCRDHRRVIEGKFRA